MREVILISSVILSGLLVFLLFKTMKNETHFKNEINRLNKQVNELNSSLLIQDGLNEKKTLTNSLQNNQHNVSPNSQSNIKQEYDNYVQENFNSEDLPNELKDKIDNITSQDQDLNNLDSQEQEQNLNNLDNQEQEQNLNNLDSQEHELDNTVSQDYENYSMENNFDSEILDNIELNMQMNNQELQNSSLDLNELENDNTENTYSEEMNIQGSLEELNIEENSDELLNDSDTLEETNLVSNTNVLENESNTIGENESNIIGQNESNTIGENINKLEEINVEEINNLNSSNNDLNFQLTNMKDGLTMENNSDNNNDNGDNLLINSLIDNALATNEENDENDNIDEGKDYSSYSLGDFEKLTLKELQDVARQNKLKIKGKKNELVDRVKAHYNFSKNLV